MYGPGCVYDGVTNGQDKFTFMLYIALTTHLYGKFLMSSIGTQVTLFTRDCNPGRGDKFCPREKFVSVSRHNV